LRASRPCLEHLFSLAQFLLDLTARMLGFPLLNRYASAGSVHELRAGFAFF